MADALEQTKDLFSVDDFNEDDISDKSKLISALENPFGEFRPKEEIIEKAKATGTGLLTGTLGIPSDAATLASAVSSGMAKYADSPTAMMLKDVLEKAKDDVGRPAFDKWFTKTTGLESNPENVDQLVGEVLSPTGAFLAPVKTLKNIFAPLKKGVTDFFDKMPPPDSGLAVETAGVGQLNQTKKLLDKESIAKPIETNIPALPSASELANKPTINPTIIGTQTETGKKAEAIYDDLVAKGVTDPKEIFKKTGGGYVGRDGKFRFDLDDRDAKFKKDLNSFDFDVDSEGNKLQTKTTELGKLLEFDPLYKQYFKRINVGGKDYNALKNVKVVLNYADTNNNTLGFYRSSEDTIHLNMQNLINPKFNKQQQTDYNMSTLIHEVQHAVQRREGFSSGANSDDTKDIVLDGINEDGVYKLPLGSDKKEITTPSVFGISPYNTDTAYSAYLEAELLSKAIKNNTNTDKFIHLADNISDDIPNFTGDRKIEFLRNYEILLDSKNRLSSYLKKGVSTKDKEDLVSLTMDVLPSDFTKAKSAFGFKDRDTFANFMFEDLKSVEDLKGFVDRAYNRAKVNINLDDKALAKLETEQARRLKNDEALLNFKDEVDREATRLYLDEYGEMEARLVEQRYARRQELRKDPMLLTDEQITEKMLEDTGAIFKEPDKYGRTAKILGGFNKNSYIPNKQMYDNVQESVIEFPQNPSKAKKKFDLQKIEKKQADARKLEDEQLKIQNMKIAEAHAPMVKLLGAEETTKVANNSPTLNADGTGFTENSLVFKNLSDRYTEEALSVLNPEITWIRIPKIYEQKPFQKYKDGDILRNAEGKTVKIELTSFLPVTDKKLYNNPNVVNVSALGKNVNKKQYHVEPAYILGDGKYVRLTDLERVGYKRVGKPDLSIISDTKKMNKGGDMNKQMEMFEEGGLKQEGGTIDPVSGNDVPPGSTQEEVRDDIPAQLSEGEFVFPADVVRYIGLEKLMRLRQEAKQGLKMMEEMGQMGNSEEATMPDDLPFDETDLDIEDEEEYNNDTQEMNQGGMVRVGGMEMPRPRIAGQQMAEGGVVKAQTGTFVAPGTGVTTIPSQFAGQNLPSYKPTETIQSGTSPAYTVPIIPAAQTGYDPKFMTGPEMQTGQVAPSFQNLIGRRPGQYDEFREYVNDAGMRLQIPFKDGQPIYPIPEGYKFVDPEEEQTETPTVQTTQTKTTTTTGEGGDDTGARVGTTMVGKTGKGITDKSLTDNQKAGIVMSALDKATTKGSLGVALQTLGTLGVPGAAALGGFDSINPDRTALDDVLGQYGYNATTANAALNDPMAAIGLNQQQAANMANSVSQAELSSDAMQEAISQAMYGMSKAEATAMLGVPANTTLGTRGYKNGQVDPTTNATYSFGQATDDDGNVAYGSIDDFGIAMSASAKTGFLGGLKDAERVSKYGKTEKARQTAKDYIADVEEKNRLKQQPKTFDRMSADTRSDQEVADDLDSISQGVDVDARGEYGFNVEETFGSGEAPSAPDFSDVSDDAGPGETSDDGPGSEMGGEDVYKGSLITKRKASGKTKKKYMKRGGLASKK